MNERTDTTRSALDRAHQDGMLDGVRGWPKDMDGCAEHGTDDAYLAGYAEGEAAREKAASK